MKSLRLLLPFVFFVLTLNVKAQTAVDTLSEYPNPFSTIAHISFDLVSADTVDLQIINALGQVVAFVLDHTALPSGSYQINYDGSALPNGIYVLRLSLTHNTYLKKIMKVGESTSIHQAVSQNHVLFPNPTDGLLNIPFEGNKIISIHDVTGSLLGSSKINEDVYHLNAFHQGVYLVKVYDSKNRLLAAQKIIKTN